MTARQKLNRLHLSGDIMLAAIAGMVAGSWWVFAVGVVVLVALDIHTGQVRTAKRRKQERAVEQRAERRRT